MNKGLFYLSTLLFLASIVATCLSLLGFDIEKTLPLIWLNNIGVFIFLIPCGWILSKNKIEFTAQHKFFVIVLGLIYLLCFFNSYFNMTPIEKSGHYFLINHGNQLQIINEVQYLKTRTGNFISNSTQWMFFYGISMMIYFLNWKKKTA